MKIWALHGFLGLPADFDSVQAHCQKSLPNLEWESVDYLKTRELSSANPIHQWGTRFNRWVQAKSSGDQNVLVGYSQGGRLALHALKDDPKLWSGCVILSANPGILDWEKPARLKADQEWAQKFLNENFLKTVEKWNAQSVFQGSQAEPLREESKYNRQQLADCLVHWSVAKQENFFGFLSQSTMPLLYVSGEIDSKYSQIGQQLKNRNSNLGFAKIQNSGHRVIFDQPELAADRMVDYFNKLGRGIA